MVVQWLLLYEECRDNFDLVGDWRRQLWAAKLSRPNKIGPRNYRLCLIRRVLENDFISSVHRRP